MWVRGRDVRFDGCDKGEDDQGVFTTHGVVKTDFELVKGTERYG